YSPKAHKLARPVAIVVCLCMVHSFPKGTRPLVDPLRGNIPLAGVHFRALLAPVIVLLHGAKSWQLRTFLPGVPLVLARIMYPLKDRRADTYYNFWHTETC